jgi:hypothetical protein
MRRSAGDFLPQFFDFAPHFFCVNPLRPGTFARPGSLAGFRDCCCQEQERFETLQSVEPVLFLTPGLLRFYDDNTLFADTIILHIQESGF